MSLFYHHRENDRSSFKHKLFGSETLNGMQMVQVNGGLPIPWPLMWKEIMYVATLVSAGIAVHQCSSGTPGATAPTVDSSTTFEAETDGKGLLIIKSNGWYLESADSMITITGNGTTTQKVYNAHFAPTNPDGTTKPW